VKKVRIRTKYKFFHVFVNSARFMLSVHVLKESYKASTFYLLEEYKMELVIKHTKEMSNIELIKVFQARVNVFIVEQNCIYQEVDEFDLNTLHVMLKKGEEIVAYSRIIEHPSYITFGRVLVVEKYRKSNYGREIVQATLNKIKEGYKQTQVRISGQAYLKSFYESFGFESVSDIYLEDNIPHITFQMHLNH